jgi:type IX secretion system PorP/SprF family membrane protein
MQKILYIALFTSSLSFGQNTVRFSQFNLAKSLYNPGALATDAKYTADLIYRNQWAGVDGAPTTVGFNAAAELMDDMAVGINFYNDRIGASQTTSVSAMYSYRLLFDRRNYLALGVGLGIDNFSTNLAGAITTTAQDPTFSTSYSRFKFNSSFGLYYRNSKFYLGASIPQMFQDIVSGPNKGFRPPLWHYMLASGYYFELSDRFILNPNLQVKMVLNAPIQADLVMRGITNNFAFSLGYRSENSLIAGFDYTFAGKVRVGYSFNYDLGSLARTKGMSHEVYIGLGWPYYFKKDGFGDRQYIGKKSKFQRNYTKRYKRHIHH